MKGRLIPYAIINSAKNGDQEAVNLILTHYNNDIDFHATRTMFDEHGNPRSVIDPEIKQRIQAKIIDCIIYDFDPSRLPDGEKLED